MDVPKNPAVPAQQGEMCPFAHISTGTGKLTGEGADGIILSRGAPQRGALHTNHLMFDTEEREETQPCIGS